MCFQWPRLFALLRDGKIIAYGCEFDNGKCAVNWCGQYRSTVIWDRLDDLKQVNGHSDTKFIFER